MSVELVEPDDFPRTGTRAEINRYLERFYNAGRRAEHVRALRVLGEGRHARTARSPCRRPRGGCVGRRAGDARPGARASSRRVGRDATSPSTSTSRRTSGSTAWPSAELVTWLQQEFGFSVDTPESLTHRRRRRPRGRRPGRVRRRRRTSKAPPAAWFAASGNRTVLTLPPGDTLTGRVPEAGRRPAAPAALRRPGERHAHLSRPGDGHPRAQAETRAAAGPVRRHHDARLGGRRGVPARRAVRRQDAGHGELDRRARARCGTRSTRWASRPSSPPRALVAKLGASGVDLSAHRGHVPVRRRPAGVGRPAEKIRAALTSRLSWASLERATPPETAVVLFTSGSESLPKAVPLTHRNLLTNIADILTDGPAGGARHHRRACCRRSIPSASPPRCCCSWCLGLRTVFHPNPDRVGAAGAGSSRPTRPRCSSARPRFSAGSCASATDRQLSTLRLAVTGAEKCPDSLFATLGERWPSLIVLEGYGITECSPVVAVNPMDAPVPGTHRQADAVGGRRRRGPRADAARGAGRDRHAAGARAERLRRLPATTRASRRS